MVPLKEALGIDDFYKVKSEYRSWNGLKNVFPPNSEKNPFTRRMVFMGAHGTHENTLIINLFTNIIPK